MLKNISKLEFQIGEKIYQFLCDMDSPLDHVKLALSEFLQYVQKVEDSVKVKQTQENESKVEEIAQ